MAEHGLVHGETTCYSVCPEDEWLTDLALTDGTNSIPLTVVKTYDDPWDHGHHYVFQAAAAIESGTKYQLVAPNVTSFVWGADGDILAVNSPQDVTEPIELELSRVVVGDAPLLDCGNPAPSSCGFDRTMFVETPQAHHEVKLSAIFPPLSELESPSDQHTDYEYKLDVWSPEELLAGEWTPYRLLNEQLKLSDEYCFEAKARHVLTEEEIVIAADCTADEEIEQADVALKNTLEHQKRSIRHCEQAPEGFQEQWCDAFAEEIVRQDCATEGEQPQVVSNCEQARSACPPIVDQTNPEEEDETSDQDIPTDSTDEADSADSTDDPSADDSTEHGSGCTISPTSPYRHPPVAGLLTLLLAGALRMRRRTSTRTVGAR